MVRILASEPNGLQVQYPSGLVDPVVGNGHHRGLGKAMLREGEKLAPREVGLTTHSQTT